MKKYKKVPNELESPRNEIKKIKQLIKQNKQNNLQRHNDKIYFAKNINKYTKLTNGKDKSK